jgi:hypothetical protein
METFTFNDVEYKIEDVSEAAQQLLQDINSVAAMKNAKAMEANAFAALEARLTADLGKEIGAPEDAEVIEGD